MADMNYTNTPQAPEGMRKVKKIKRPIKRLVPGNPASPSSPVPGGQINQAPQQRPNAQLDDLLDNQLNLPAVNNRPNVNPRNPNFNRAPQNYSRPERFIDENDFEERGGFMDQLIEGNLVTIKGVVVIAILVFFVGFLFAKLLSGGNTVVKDGLQGVVINAEVPRGRARCGVAERTQGCVLYIMNPQRQDLQGRDFYDLASQLTGRQRFVIETGNMRYSNVKIRPGDIAQINIPPLQ